MKCRQCENTARAAGLCSKHYSQQYRARLVQNKPAPEPMYATACSECGQPVKARGLCMRHYQQWRRTYTGKGKRRRMGVCIDDLPHVWGKGICRVCLEPRPGEWV